VKKILLGIVTLFVVFSAIGVLAFRSESVYVAFYEDAMFSTVSSSASWESFRDTLRIDETARIENVELIVDKNHVIHSIQFQLVAKKNEKFDTYRYSQCLTCEEEAESRTYFFQASSPEWLQYDRLIEAHTFFDKLDVLYNSGMLIDENFEYTAITSRGEFEGIGFPGRYYVIAETEIREIEKSPKHHYEGFNVQIYGTNQTTSFGTDEQTRTVFIDMFKEVIKE